MGFLNLPRSSQFPVKYGYRHGDFELKKIGPIKEGARVFPKYHLDDARAVVVATSLGIHALNASAPHGDPYDIPTVVAGLAKRIARKPPTPNPSLIGKFREFVKRWISRNLDPLDSNTDFSIGSWLESSNYSARRASQLHARYEQMRGSVTHPSEKKSQRVKCFVKDESYLCAKHVRSIFARVDDIKVVIGPFVKAIESSLYRSPFFVKHIPVADRARVMWDRLRLGDKIVSSDYTGYESHFTAEILSIEMHLYEYMLQNVPRGKWVIEMLRNMLSGENYCMFRTLMAIIPACRMSGEMNTSLGNGFMNLMLYLFLNEVSGNTHVDCLVEGDDLIGCFTGKNLSAELYAELGFTVKLEYHADVCTASFCGLIFDPEELVSLPNPIKVLLNTGWTTANYVGSSLKTRMGLLRAKGFSLVSQYSGVPIVQSLGLYILRVTNSFALKIPVKWTEWQTRHFTTEFKVKEPGFKTRMLMERVYGVSVFAQYDIEKYFDEKNVISPISHALLDDLWTLEQKEYNLRFVRDYTVGERYPSILSVYRTTKWKKEVVDKIFKSTIVHGSKFKVSQDFCF